MLVFIYRLLNGKCGTKLVVSATILPWFLAELVQDEPYFFVWFPSVPMGPAILAAVWGRGLPCPAAVGDCWTAARVRRGPDTEPATLCLHVHSL